MAIQDDGMFSPIHEVCMFALVLHSLIRSFPISLTRSYNHAVPTTHRLLNRLVVYERRKYGDGLRGGYKDERRESGRIADQRNDTAINILFVCRYASLLTFYMEAGPARSTGRGLMESIFLCLVIYINR